MPPPLIDLDIDRPDVNVSPDMSFKISGGARDGTAPRTPERCSTAAPLAVLLPLADDEERADPVTEQHDEPRPTDRRPLTSVRLQDYGFAVPRGALATTEDEAASIAARLGGPVALKVVSADILHKTDIGGVELDLDSEEAVRAAYRRIVDSAGTLAPGARLEGLQVEEMIRGGVEVIIGLKNDAQFGPVIMFGLGGIFTELLDDVAFRVLPIGEEDAREMVADLRGARILRGYRGRPAVDPEPADPPPAGSRATGYGPGGNPGLRGLQPRRGVGGRPQSARLQADDARGVKRPRHSCPRDPGRRRHGRPGDVGCRAHVGRHKARRRYPPPGDLLQGPLRGRDRCVGHAGQDRLCRARKPDPARVPGAGLPGQPGSRLDPGTPGLCLAQRHTRAGRIGGVHGRSRPGARTHTRVRGSRASTTW